MHLVVGKIQRPVRSQRHAQPLQTRQPRQKAHVLVDRAVLRAESHRQLVQLVVVELGHVRPLHQAQHPLVRVVRLAQVHVEHLERVGACRAVQDRFQRPSRHRIPRAQTAEHEGIRLGHPRQRLVPKRDPVPGAWVHDVIGGHTALVDGHFHQAGGLVRAGLQQRCRDILLLDLPLDLVTVRVRSATADDGAVGTQGPQANQDIERCATQLLAAGQVVPQYFAKAGDLHDVPFRCRGGEATMPLNLPQFTFHHATNPTSRAAARAARGTGS